MHLRFLFERCIYLQQFPCAESFQIRKSICTSFYPVYLFREMMKRQKSLRRKFIIVFITQNGTAFKIETFNYLTPIFCIIITFRRTKILKIWVHFDLQYTLHPQTYNIHIKFHHFIRYFFYLLFMIK